MKSTKLSVYLEESEVKKLDEMTKKSDCSTRTQFIKNIIQNYDKEMEKSFSYAERLEELIIRISAIRAIVRADLNTKSIEELKAIVMLPVPQIKQQTS